VRIRRVLKSNEGFFFNGDFVCVRDIRDVFDLVRVRCAIPSQIIADQDSGDVAEVITKVRHMWRPHIFI
jgi:hypothetical protein